MNYEVHCCVMGKADDERTSLFDWKRSGRLLLSRWRGWTERDRATPFIAEPSCQAGSAKPDERSDPQASANMVILEHRVQYLKEWSVYMSTGDEALVAESWFSSIVLRQMEPITVNFRYGSVGSGGQWNWDENMDGRGWSWEKLRKSRGSCLDRSDPVGQLSVNLGIPSDSSKFEHK